MTTGCDRCESESEVSVISFPCGSCDGALCDHLPTYHKCDLCFQFVHADCSWQSNCWCHDCRICDKCTDSLPECERCEEQYCSTCALKSDCSYCDMPVCSECVVDCKSCGSFLCDNEECDRWYKEHYGQCVSCKEMTCKHSILTCEVCCQGVCDECRHTDPLTGDYYCELCYNDIENGIDVFSVAPRA